jgi:hypothetical protein
MIVYVHIFLFQLLYFLQWSKAVSKVNNKVAKILDPLLDCLRRGRQKNYKDSVRGRKGSGCQLRHWLALLKTKKMKKSMTKISPLTAKALDMMMELLAAMMPPWPLSAMVIRANSMLYKASQCFTKCDKATIYAMLPCEFYKASQCFTK